MVITLVCPSKKIHLQKYNQWKVRLLHFSIRYLGNVNSNDIKRFLLIRDTLYSCNDIFFRYFISRGKIVSKVAKYPHISDYRRAVQELDEKEYVSLWLVMCEVRNRYCSLHDLVIKNLEKIKKPRSSNAQSLY